MTPYQKDTKSEIFKTTETAWTRRLWD